MGSSRGFYQATDKDAEDGTQYESVQRMARDFGVVDKPHLVKHIAKIGNVTESVALSRFNVALRHNYIERCEPPAGYVDPEAPMRPLTWEEYQQEHGAELAITAKRVKGVWSFCGTVDGCTYTAEAPDLKTAIAHLKLIAEIK